MADVAKASEDSRFTLLQVISATTLAALLAFLWFVYLGWQNRKADQANCARQLRSLTLALKAYANDEAWAPGSPRRFPRAEPEPPSANALFQHFLIKGGYVSNVRAFRCPADKYLVPVTEERVIDEGQCSYSYAQGLVDDGDEAQAIMSDSLVSGRSPHGRAGFNVSYVDGHGRWETAPPLLNNRVDPIYPSDDAYLAKANSVELWEDLKLVIWGAVFAAVSIIWVGAVVRRWKLRRDLSFLR